MGARRSRSGVNEPGGGADLDLVAGREPVDQPLGEQPGVDPAHPDPRQRHRPGRRSSTSGAPPAASVSRRSVRYWPGRNAKVSLQVGGHVEGDGDGVVAEPLDVGHPQACGSRRGRGTRHLGHLPVTAQISFMCSNGSRQAVQRRRAVQAVGPKRESSSVAGEPQRGQRTAVARRGQRQRHRARCPRPDVRRAARCRARRACAGRRSVIQSVLHGGESTVRTSTARVPGRGQRARAGRRASPRAPGSPSRSG